MRGGHRGGRGQNRGNRGFRGSRGNYSRGDRQNNLGYNNYNKPWHSQTKRDIPTKRLSEEDIGVTEYLSEHQGFNGIIKSRFSDFQVSEINEAGEVAQLTDESPPEAPLEELVEDDEELLLNKYNLEILPMETWDKINKLAVSTEQTSEKIEVDVSGMSKEDRTKIHEAVKKAFGESIIGSTVTVEDKKFVTFTKYRKGVRFDNRVKWVWGGEYVHFVVYKENCDTMEAASVLAQRLHISPSMLGYAGTKDRRAKTSQWFSIRRFEPRRIASAAQQNRMPRVRVGNFCFKDYHLKLGMLKGNRFRICLRNVTAPDDCVDVACKLLNENGFINYYGLQRFGSRADVPTHEIGLKLLQGNFKKAIDSILTQRPDGPLSAALQQYSSGDVRAAGRAVPPRDVTPEARLLRALAARPNDLLGALQQVSRNCRLLYIHSYQSLIWNRAATHRLTQSRTPLVGDLVPLEPVAQVTEDELDEESDNEDSENVTRDQNTDNIEKTEEATCNGTENNTDSNENTDKKKKGNTPKKVIPVKVLTKEDIDSGKYSIFDIVLPLPGYSIEYPPNMREFYEECLTKDELTMDMKHKYKSYNLSGGYRHVVCRVSDMSWRCVRYDRPTDDLVLSDADLIDGVDITHNEDGKYKALLLTMTLPTSCYATMALRELLRVGTSSDVQALQNDYHVDKDAVKRKMADDETDAKKTKVDE
ncbi:pseudouridylate synthase 7 homolog [Danaus plexippus]|nr:pseudouridylate synthase 7 homolog [Danaus plexippus]